MKDVAVVGYCRTGIARAFRGALNQTHGIPLAAHVLKEAVARAGVESGEVEDAVLGCGLPQGATGHNIGRTAALEAVARRPDQQRNGRPSRRRQPWTWWTGRRH